MLKLFASLAISHSTVLCEFSQLLFAQADGLAVSSKVMSVFARDESLLDSLQPLSSM
jgi:hypothetical protein